MKKNIKLNVSFCRVDNKKFAILSTNPTFFKKYIEGQKESLAEMDFSSYEIEKEFGARKDLSVHKALEKITESQTIIIAENVSNEEQLSIWIKIKGNTYEATQKWDSFLVDHNLLNEWISGNLFVTTGNYYKESSKQFGLKKSFKKLDIKMDSNEKLWDFSKLFEGGKSINQGHYAKYSAESESRIIKVRLGNKQFDTNEDWLKEVNPEERSYSITEFKTI